MSNNNIIYLTNKNDYFLVVHCPINFDLLKGCTIHNCLSDMYDHVCKMQNLDFDEVDGSEWSIVYNEVYCDYFLWCNRGLSSRIELDDNQTIEQFINEWSL